MFSKKKKKVDISAPSNFQHRVHTGFDNSSNKFVGLPKQWASLVVDTPASSSPYRPSPFIDPSIITPTDAIDVQVNICRSFKTMQNRFVLAPTRTQYRTYPVFKWFNAVG